MDIGPLLSILVPLAIVLAVVLGAARLLMRVPDGAAGGSQRP